eukprot:661590-Rhodomonas_salina.1
MAHGRKKGKPVRPPPPVKPVDYPGYHYYQAPTIADGRRPAHEDKTHHVGRVIPCSAQYLFDGLNCCIAPYETVDRLLYPIQKKQMQIRLRK